MKPFRMFIRSIRDAFKSVFRNFSLSLASISCITITLIVVAVSIIASLNVNNIAKVIKEDVTIVVFIENDVDKAGVNKIGELIRNISNVNENNVILKSKEEIKLEMASEDSPLGTIVSNYKEETNPFKDTYQVTVEDITKINETAKTIENIEGVYEINYGETMVNKLISVFSIIEKVSIVAVIALIIVTVFLITNTIKLTIFSRKREISIMRLVGASNFTIKMPFVIEGMVLGIVGSILPILIVIYGYFALYKHLNGQLYSQLLQLVSPEPFIYIVSLIVLVIGMIVGMFGSYKAVKKYLKV